MPRSARRGAGSIPALARILHTVEGAIRTPRPASSPWILRSGFSPARRRTSLRISRRVAGRPERPARDLATHRRRSRSRCQRKIVSGVTRSLNPARRALGITLERGLRRVTAAGSVPSSTATIRQPRSASDAVSCPAPQPISSTRHPGAERVRPGRRSMRAGSRDGPDRTAWCPGQRSCVVALDHLLSRQKAIHGRSIRQTMNVSCGAISGTERGVHDVELYIRYQ